MRTARCTQDNVTYLAIDFNLEVDFATKKRFLVCLQCEGPAYYRGPTRNGREACFGAMHAEGCTLATIGHNGTTEDQGGAEDEIFTAGQRIVVDFNVGAPVAGLDTQPAGGLADIGNGGEFNGEGALLREVMHRRLSSLLRTLIESEEFRRSTQLIEVVELGEFAVADFFVNFADVTDDHVGSSHGYWGFVPDAGIKGNTLWFNSGGREDMSVLLDQRYFEEVYQRFHIEEVDEIAGAYILVFGELKRARNTGKKYVQITDPCHFTLRLA